MVVRESARRREIQRSIYALRLSEQEIQRLKEKERIEAWHSIKCAKDSGRDWEAMRDRLISVMLPALPAETPDPALHNNMVVPTVRQRAWLRRLWCRIERQFL